MAHATFNATADDINSTLTGSESHTTRHERFYFPDGNVVVQVDDVLFRVHHSVVSMHSDLLETLLRLPQPTPQSTPVQGESQDRVDPPLQGTCDSAPISLDILDDSEDFARLLGIFYGCGGSSWLRNKDTLIKILIAAHKLQCMTIFRRAAKHAEKHLKPLARLGLGLRLGMDAALEHSRELAEGSDGEDSDGTTSGANHLWIASAIRDAVLDFNIDSRFEDETGMVSDSMRVRLQRARMAVVQARLEKLSHQIHIAASIRLSDYKSLAVLVPVLPFTSRAQLLAVARARTVELVNAAALNGQSYAFNQVELDSWIPGHEEECSLVDQMWHSFD